MCQVYVGMWQRTCRFAVSVAGNGCLEVAGDIDVP